MNDSNKCKKCAKLNNKYYLSLVGIVAFLLFPIVFYLAQRSSQVQLLEYVLTIVWVIIGVAIGSSLVDFYLTYKINKSK